MDKYRNDDNVFIYLYEHLPSTLKFNFPYFPFSLTIDSSALGSANFTIDSIGPFGNISSIRSFSLISTNLTLPSDFNKLELDFFYFYHSNFSGSQIFASSLTSKFLSDDSVSDFFMSSQMFLNYSSLYIDFYFDATLISYSQDAISFSNNVSTFSFPSNHIFFHVTEIGFNSLEVPFSFSINILEGIDSFPSLSFFSSDSFESYSSFISSIQVTGVSPSNQIEILISPISLGQTAFYSTLEKVKVSSLFDDFALSQNTILPFRIEYGNNFYQFENFFTSTNLSSFSFQQNQDVIIILHDVLPLNFIFNLTSTPSRFYGFSDLDVLPISVEIPSSSSISTILMLKKINLTLKSNHSFKNISLDEAFIQGSNISSDIVEIFTDKFSDLHHFPSNPFSNSTKISLYLHRNPSSISTSETNVSIFDPSLPSIMLSKYQFNLSNLYIIFNIGLVKLNSLPYGLISFNFLGGSPPKLNFMFDETWKYAKNIIFHFSGSSTNSSSIIISSSNQIVISGEISDNIKIYDSNDQVYDIMPSLALAIFSHAYYYSPSDVGLFQSSELNSSSLINFFSYAQVSIFIFQDHPTKYSFDFPKFQQKTNISSIVSNTSFEIKSIIGSSSDYNPTLTLQNISLTLPSSLNSWYFDRITLEDSNIHGSNISVKEIHFPFQSSSSLPQFNKKDFYSNTTFWLDIPIKPKSFIFSDNNLSILDEHQFLSNVLIPNDYSYSHDLIINLISSDISSISIEIYTQLSHNWTFAFQDQSSLSEFQSIESIVFSGIDQKEIIMLTIYGIHKTTKVHGLMKNLYLANEKEILFSNEQTGTQDGEKDSSNSVSVIIGVTISSLVVVFVLVLVFVFFFKKKAANFDTEQVEETETR